MKKFFKGYIFYSLVCDAVFFAIFSFWLVTALFTKIEVGSAPYYITLFVTFALLTGVKFLYNVLFIKKSGYEIGKDSIACRQGVIFKKFSVIEYKNIHNVTKKQNILQKLFNVASLSIDSGSGSAPEAEINIITEAREADKIIDEINNKRNESHENDIACKSVAAENLTAFGKENENKQGATDNTYRTVYVFTAADKLKLTVINVCRIIFSLIIISVIASATYFIIARSLPTNGTETVNDGGQPTIISAIICTAFIVAFLVVFGLIRAFLIYYKYTVKKSGGALEISYGLLSRTTNNFPINKIMGVKIAQNFVGRIFGYASVKLEVIGYLEDGDNNTDKDAYSAGTLFPLVKLTEADRLIREILPWYASDEKQFTPPALSPFLCAKLCLGVVIPSVAALYAVLVASVVFKVDGGINLYILKTGACLVGLYAFVAAMFIIVNAMLEKNFGGIAISTHSVTLYTGGLKRSKLVVEKKNIVAVEEITTKKRSERNIASYKIHFYTNLLADKITIKNVDSTIKDRIFGCVNSRKFDK